MKRKNTKHRLVPLETLYPNRPPKQQTTRKIHFQNPGVSSEIPEKTEENNSVRYLQAKKIHQNILSLSTPLKEIEDDTKFIVNTMNYALQVPKAINITFNRIHGRLYDIQREIEEFSTDNLDKHAVTIQSKFRSFSSKQHYNVILNAVHNTIRRDCSAIHESLLGFFLAYSKRDDHFRVLLNRHFVNQSRNALKHWRDWSIESHEATNKIKHDVLLMQRSWLDQHCKVFLRKWKYISFSKHSRKALFRLHQMISEEAQKRVVEKTSNSDFNESDNSLLELLKIEKRNVIIEIGNKNHENHLKNFIFKTWIIYVKRCKDASKRANAIARSFWINRRKRNFFDAWYSLSVGRIIVFGGFKRWKRPQNKYKILYHDNFTLMKNVIQSWKYLCDKRKKVNEFIRKHEKIFLRNCFLEYKRVIFERKERISQMFEGYIDSLRKRLRKSFRAWYYYTTKEKVRKEPYKFILERSKLKNERFIIRQSFRRWKIKFIQHQSNRLYLESNEIDSFIFNWKSAGDEMEQSLEIINNLNAKLRNEIEKRKNDLNRSIKRINFMKNEQKSLSFAMKNIAIEIQNLHKIVGKSTIGYFLDIRPIQMNAVDNAPEALNNYLKKMELDKQNSIEKKKKMENPNKDQDIPIRRRNDSSLRLSFNGNQRKFFGS